MSAINDETLTAAVRHLKTDKKMARVIRQVGPPTFQFRRRRFATLVSSILSQQISGAAARTIQNRVKERIGRFTAAQVGSLTVEEYRELGVSKQKAGYLLDLAEKANDGDLRFSRHGGMGDEQVIEELVQVKGVGRWTAQMYLIFSLGRADVFPEDDLGVRNGMSRIYELEPDCERTRLREIAETWTPYRSIASWYCWQALELDN